MVYNMLYLKVAWKFQNACTVTGCAYNRELCIGPILLEAKQYEYKTPTCVWNSHLQTTVYII